MDATVRARFKLAADGSSRLVLCGKLNKKGRATCPGSFGLQPPRHGGPPVMRINGILRRDSRGVFRPTNRALKQQANGQPVRLRRSHIRVGILAGQQPDVRDYGPQGERAGEIVHTFPIMAICPRCLTPNEIHHFSHTA